MTRTDGRGSSHIRPPSIELGVQHNPEGSLLYRCGGTLVLVASSVQEGVPDFLRGSGRGWLTAEYAMHPRANPDRGARDSRRGRIDGRTQEIQRLIGRALRSAVALDQLGERTIFVDCDVLDADGGTRTASITGGYVATALACDWLRRRGLVEGGVLRGPVAAISVGLVGGAAMVDLCYQEDSSAQVDLNVVGTPDDSVVEVQGTAEGPPVPRARFEEMLDLAMAAMPELAKAQRETLGRAGVELDRLLAK